MLQALKMFVNSSCKKWKSSGQDILFMIKNKTLTHKNWKSDVSIASLKESEKRFLSCRSFCPPSPATCYTVIAILNIKFYFFSCLQKDFSACKPEQLIPPPLLPSWPWTKNSLCQSCFLVYFGHELQMLWAGSESGRFCLIWLWHCWWIPSK